MVAYKRFASHQMASQIAMSKSGKLITDFLKAFLDKFSSQINCSIKCFDNVIVSRIKFHIGSSGYFPTKP